MFAPMISATSISAASTPPNSGHACSDINACTLNDFCSNGVCIGGPAPNCDDGNPCTDDGCHFLLGCTHTANLGPCDDGDSCSLVDTCDANGQCIGSNVTDCNDGNLCTDDICDGQGGCQHPANTRPCDDGDLCTQGDSCSGGLCNPGPPVDCNDGNNCTDDLCKPAQGCLYSDNTNPCDDQDACSTDDRCGGGICLAGPPLDCDDSNLCTNDSCNSAIGCVHADNSIACDDGDLCTPVDLCANGVCSGVGQLDCNDSNICTLDTCDMWTGCGHEPILDCMDLDGDLLVDRFDPCVTLQWSDPVSIPPDQNPRKFLLMLKKLDRANEQDVQVKGFFRGPAGGPSFDPSTDGIHIRIVDAAGELFHANIPGGLRGSSPCGPKDGWKVGGSASSPNWRYSNKSGRLPPDCVSGSARGVSQVQVRDLRASSKAALQFKLKAQRTSLLRLPILPITRLQADFSLGMQTAGGETSLAARNGQCAEAIFRGNPIRSSNPKPFCKVKQKNGAVTNIICKGP